MKNEILIKKHQFRKELISKRTSSLKQNPGNDFIFNNHAHAGKVEKALAQSPPHKIILITAGRIEQLILIYLFLTKLNGISFKYYTQQTLS